MVYISPGSSSFYTQVGVWLLVFLISVRGLYKNIVTKDYPYIAAFAVMVPASAYFLADLFGVLPEGFVHVFR